jgi:glycerol-3-phosphate dehydrogenase subunit B
MAIESEVLVIGGGIAGCTAALAAARCGADVRLVANKDSTLSQASGLIDVLGVHDGELVADPFDVIPDLPEGHPYERAGIDALEAGLDLFDEVVPDYAGGHTERNALVPTHGGTVKPTARYPETTAAGLASRDAETLLVGFEALTDFDAPMAAAHLRNADVPFPVRGVTLEFPGDLRADAKRTRYAHMLVENEPIDDGERRTREALVTAIDAHLEGAERVGLPAILGREGASALRADLESRLGVPVFEIPMGPPSLPGLRLEDALYDALDAAGVSMDTGNPVIDSTAEDGRVEHVTVERTHSPVPYRAEQYVLATGGLVGKGIDSDRKDVREPLFDCHVPHPADRYDWFADQAFGEHAFARFGVDVDRALRPRDAGGVVEFDNLRAAGAVLGGADFAAEKSGSGISLATGWKAGTRAAEGVA